MDAFVTKPATCTPQQANVLTESILNMLVTDMRPLSMVDDEGFKEMIKQFNPDYHDNFLPGRSHFTTLMEKKYHATFEKVSLSFSLNLIYWQECIKTILLKQQ